MVVGGEKRLGVPFVLVDILDNRPRDGDAIVGARAAAEFVKKNQAAFGEVVEDGCGFVHLHHEGGLS